MSEVMGYKLYLNKASKHNRKKNPRRSVFHAPIKKITMVTMVSNYK